MVICPAILIWMTPAQLHINLELLLSAGILPICTVGQPGAHGAAVTGMQGIGVKTPNAAAVAAATIGLAMDWHMPKGKIFTIGLLSIILAIGIVVVTRFAGNTISELGATPKLHCKSAPPHTTWPILHSPLKKFATWHIFNHTTKLFTATTNYSEIVEYCLISW
jgi:hypothetical protein